MSQYKQVGIRRDRAKHILQGHPWVFSGALEPGHELVLGDLCEVYCQKDFVGIGYFNSATDISIRMLTHRREAIDEAFFESRFRELKRQKEEWVRDTDAYRVVFGESDGLPGLIVDRYDHTLVAQFHTAGIEKLKDSIVPALASVFEPRCILQRSAGHSERIEGMQTESARALYGDLEEDVTIHENGFQFLVNVVKGQKTGFFLDQRANRAAIPAYCAGRNVLNCFSYTGGFSVYAARVARRVTSVDISAGAIDYARRNFALNGFDPDAHAFLAKDVFDYLKEIEAGEFDTIILDPPSFARRKSQVPQAIKAYTTINSKALEKLRPGGVLVSSSCTAHIDELTFIKILHQSSVNTRCQLKVLHSAVQPFDHAYNLHFPEGRYLKFLVMLKI